MLPPSYDLVSQETKHTVQLFMARSIGFLQGRGFRDDEVANAMEQCMEIATREAVDWAVAEWRKNQKLCLLLDDSPLSSEFLEAVGLTEEEARNGNSQTNGHHAGEQEDDHEAAEPHADEGSQSSLASRASSRASSQASSQASSRVSSQVSS
ncbi:hypothetical protein DHEL01_v203591 [Diaporthe helianthi]|uniref:Uncharacterized protein n=1 Tax=Diaporthe helianthi TaxID=158607 RepID=A0A2P5I692_DIAHE|nr:hypothetical protein DHEL01_v203591 [Diaporthe helianthi]